MHRLSISAVSLFLVATSVGAEDGEARSTSDVAAAIRDRITVTGRQTEGQSLREYTSDFVAEIGDPVGAGMNFGFARWEDDICVGVENIEAGPAQYIADRISEVALDLGLEPGQPGCDPNISIIFTVDGAALASRLVETEPTLFRPHGGAGGTNQGFEALDEFATSDTPVRWWLVSSVVDRLGIIAIELPAQRYVKPCLGEIRTCVHGGANSHISNAVRDILRGAVVIVDVTKLDDASWTQVADYLTMVTLAQIEPDAEPAGYDTILNMFRGPSRPSGMTDWDKSYLRALYELERHRLPEQQRSALTREMMRQQDPGE